MYTLVKHTFNSAANGELLITDDKIMRLARA